MGGNRNGDVLRRALHIDLEGKLEELASERYQVPSFYSVRMLFIRTQLSLGAMVVLRGHVSNLRGAPVLLLSPDTMSVLLEAIYIKFG